MKRSIMKNLISLFCLVCLLASCGSGEESGGITGDGKDWQVAKVAVILPMQNGLDKHWLRVLELASHNIKDAFKNQGQGVELQFEWYDENGGEMETLSKELAGREDIVAAIGGLYSVTAEIIATQFTRAEKLFFTLATTEEFVRAYAKKGYLWAMVETDITQCEVLLAKALYYKAESVALLVNGDDAYGKTFIDWFAFQASELSMKVEGIYTYNEGNLDAQTRNAHAGGADCIICVPAVVEDIKVVLEATNRYASEQGTASRMLFSDTGYGKDVVKLLGGLGEGMEGVTFGAAPEYGFEIIYESMFGEQATLGEAQAYDAALLLGYGLFCQMLNPDMSLRDALRKVVNGRGRSFKGWRKEDICLTIDALARGDEPDISGASGELDFDSKVFTNVLNTTYYHYKIYNGRYILLDYNTSDGGKRTEATLAGWNRKAKQMQEFEVGGGDIVYPELSGQWALLVAASSGWSNYRHQADVLAIYQLLKRNGYTDDRIVLIAEDDLAGSVRNPETGVVRVRPNGENVYEGAVIDYRTSELKPEDIRDILNGRRSERLPEVIAGTATDNVLVFWSGHGIEGELCWLEETSGFTVDMATEAFGELCREKHCRKVLCLVEACYSGSVFQNCIGLPGALFITAANPWETSKADIFSTELGVWMSNRFTATLQDQLNEDSAVPLRELYYRLFINTVGSHVMVYNAPDYGNIYRNTFEEFL